MYSVGERNRRRREQRAGHTTQAAPVPGRRLLASSAPDGSTDHRAEHEEAELAQRRRGRSAVGRGRRAPSARGAPLLMLERERSAAAAGSEPDGHGERGAGRPRASRRPRP